MIVILLVIGVILALIAALGFSSRSRKNAAEQPDVVPPERAESGSANFEGKSRAAGMGDD